MSVEKTHEADLNQKQTDLLWEVLGDKESLGSSSEKTREFSLDEADLLADFMGENAPLGIENTGEKRSHRIFSTVAFELTVPAWNMDRLTRSFHVTFKTIEDACHQADLWIDQTERLLENIVNSLPDT